jgi:hypothetical protein
METDVEESSTDAEEWKTLSVEVGTAMENRASITRWETILCAQKKSTLPSTLVLISHVRCFCRHHRRNGMCQGEKNKNISVVLVSMVHRDSLRGAHAISISTWELAGDERETANERYQGETATR